MLSQQEEDHSHLLRGAESHVHQKLLSHSAVLGLDLNCLLLLDLLFLLEVVFRLGLWYFQVGLFAGHLNLLFVRATASINWVFDFDERDVVSDHLLCHFIQLISLLIDPPSYSFRTFSAVL